MKYQINCYCEDLQCPASVLKVCLSSALTMSTVIRLEVGNLDLYTKLYTRKQVHTFCIVQVFRKGLIFSGCSYAAKHVECRRASEKKRLLEEVDILGSLDHPQIMRLHRVFGDTEAGYQDEIVLILEYLSGENISTFFRTHLGISGGDLYSRVMNSEEALTEKDVAGFIKQILLGNIQQILPFIF